MSSTASALTITLFVLHSIAITLHCLGIYLLSHQIKKDRSHQVPIMMNLSIAEIFMGLFDVAYNIMIGEGVTKDITDYFYTIQCCCFVISCFLILTVLTLDRFFEVYLNITYPIYFTKRVVHICLFCCWAVGFSLGIILCSLKYAIGINTLDVVFRFLFPLFELFFFVSAVVTYSYIYSKFRRLSRDPNLNSKNTLKKRKFFVPTLIIFTFFLFAIIPDQLHLFLFYIYDIGSNTFLNAILLLYVVGFICDAAIYIFFQKTTYKILRRKLNALSRSLNIFKSNSINPDTNTERRESNFQTVAEQTVGVEAEDSGPSVIEKDAAQNHDTLSNQQFLSLPKKIQKHF